MKRFLIAVLAFGFLGCTKNDDVVCTQTILKRKMGEPFKVYNVSQWSGPDQYKNYDYSYRDENGDVWVIKTKVVCE